MVKINKMHNNIELFKIVSEKNNNVCVLDTYTIFSITLIIILLLITLSFFKNYKKKV
jgi:hypothetical protein